MMKHTQAVIVLAMSLVVSCAAERTYSKELNEGCVVTFGQDLNYSTAHSGFVDKAVELVASLAVNGLEALVNREASNYSAAWTSQTRVHLSELHRERGIDLGFNWALNNGGGGFWIVLRVVGCSDVHSAKVAGLSRLDSQGKWNLQQGIVTALYSGPVEPKGARDQERIKTIVDGAIDKAIVRACSEAGDVPYLAFAATGLLMRAPHATKKAFVTEALQLVLTGYTFPVTKAKRISFSVPFTKWDQSAALLTVRFRGPLADLGYDDGCYEASLQVRVIADDLRAQDGREAKCSNEGSAAGTWITYSQQLHEKVEGAWTSPLYAVPTNQSLTLSCGVAESSNLEKELNALADEVGGLEIDVDALGF